MIIADWQNKLLASGSFISLYRIARSHVAVRSTTISVAVIFLISALPMVFDLSGPWLPLDVKAMAVGIRTVTTLGVAFATSILGFLVSGFALFFAITRSDVLILLARVKYHKSSKEISHLQFILYSFMYVFLHYLTYLGVTLAISTLLSPGSVLVGSAAYFSETFPNEFRFFAAVLFSLSFSWLILVILLLKTFIWNLYQTVLIAITVGSDLDGGRLKGLLEALQEDDDQ
ncbi:MAG: hypothetical protein EOO76_02995 [Novosphingobium sp.]|nr:MAG: hypothetical protein EOO76_02995 [Novosphingobium sp.]